MSSEADQQIIGSQSILGIESIVYLFRDVNGQEGLGLVNGINEGTGRLKKVGEEFYEFSNYEIGYQRIFRILQGKVVPVLEKLRTASGVTLSNTHAVFYHITESNNSSDNLTNSNPGWNYKFRLHLTRLGQSQMVSLYQINIVDQSPKLKLSWKNEFELIHRKKDGSEEIYNLQVIDVPTNEAVAREDYDDEVYRTSKERDQAVINLIKECQERKQPVLVGTVSIDKSESFSNELKKQSIPHKVLNARFHEQEAVSYTHLTLPTILLV